MANETLKDQQRQQQEEVAEKVSSVEKFFNENKKLIWGCVGALVIGGAAVLSICCSFLGKLAALISTIPGPVIGGISFLLYGMIGTSGLRMLVDNHVDYSKSRNLTLTSVVFVVGLSGIALKLGNVELTGMVLACVVAMALSLVFYILDKLKLTNDQ